MTDFLKIGILPRVYGILLLFILILFLEGTSQCSSHGNFEKCDEVHQRVGLTELKRILQRDFFGQHIATKIVVAALTSHLNDNSPEKPLVLSFHGSSGLGKSYVSRIIINLLFKEGVNSKHVKFYSASRDFRDHRNVGDYQNKIEREVMEVIRLCPRTIIVFDEVDMMPPKVLDAIVPFLDPNSVMQDVGQKKAVFIFLSNQGADAISDIAKKASDDKKKREDLTFRDFDDAVMNEVFNSKKGGLKKSKIIEKFLVDHFVPFLPMERRHVIQCVKADLAKLGYTFDAEEIAESLTYWPRETKLFSVAGCRLVAKNIKIYADENPFKNQDEL